jgi:biopolymer transport protein ExbB/TolQ
MGAVVSALLLAVSLPVLARAAERVWEVNGIRLESGQVERLADDMATRTVEAVEESVEGIDLRDDQRQRMHEIYREISLDVYEKVVELIERDDLSDDAKEESVRALALEGQQRSQELLRAVLDEAQMDLYSKWADSQVEAFQSRRLDSRRRRRRR